MCGISGKLNYDRDKPVSPDLLRRMTDVIQHRGPDADGQYLSSPVALGHRRLSIIDVSLGIQPMSNEDGTVWVVYNGEIYNFRELRAELESKGHQFKTSSDTEVIVHLYEEMGDRCVERFRGMFAFALWDDKRKRLLLARDRVGIKPLYYVDTGTAIVFGSEIKSLLVDPEVERKLNPRSIDRFLTYYFLPGDETPFANILKLEPGFFLTVENGKINKERYWDLVFNPQLNQLNFDDATLALQELLSRVTKDHLMSDVPVGVLLSGGVDSTGILNFAAQHSGKPLHSFTMGFSGNQFADERPFAKLAAERFGTTHHEITLSANDFRDFLPKYIWHMEEFVCEPPAIALYFVSDLAKQHGVKVLLSGEGGDEAFAGYQTYRNLILLERLKAIFGTGKSLLKAGFKIAGKAGIRQLNQYVELIDMGMPDYYFSRTSRPNLPFNRLKSKLYNDAFAEVLRNEISSSPTSALFANMAGLSPLNSMLYVDSKTWLPDDLLVKADKMTMAASVELRVPLLDFQVLEYAASLPEEFKVKGWQLKRILKNALAKNVPKEILNRKKTGFPVPYDSWIRNEMREFVFDNLLGENTALTSYFNKATLQSILESNQANGGFAKEVFSLLVLELWHQQFMSSA